MYCFCMDLETLIGGFETLFKNEFDRIRQSHEEEQYRLLEKQTQESLELERRLQEKREALMTSFLADYSLKLRVVAELYGSILTDPTNLQDYLASCPPESIINEQIGRIQTEIAALMGRISEVEKTIDKLDLESYKTEVKKSIFRKKDERRDYKNQKEELEQQLASLEVKGRRAHLVDRFKAVLDNNYYLPIIIAENKREQFDGQYEVTILLPFLLADVKNPKFPSKLINSIYQSVYDECKTLQDDNKAILYTKTNVPFVNLSLLLDSPFDSHSRDLTTRLVDIPYKNLDMFTVNMAVHLKVEKFYSEIPRSLKEEQVKKDLGKSGLEELNARGLITEDQAIAILYDLNDLSSDASKRARQEFNRILEPKIEGAEGAVGADYDVLELTVKEYKGVKVFDKAEVEKVGNEQTIVLQDGSRKFFNNRMLTLEQVCQQFGLKESYVRSRLTRGLVINFELGGKVYIPFEEATNLRKLAYR